MYRTVFYEPYQVQLEIWSFLSGKTPLLDLDKG